MTIPAGETVTSDPVGLSVEALEYLTVSLFLKRTETMKTYGPHRRRYLYHVREFCQGSHHAGCPHEAGRRISANIPLSLP